MWKWSFKSLVAVFMLTDLFWLIWQQGNQFLHRFETPEPEECTWLAAYRGQTKKSRLHSLLHVLQAHGALPQGPSHLRQELLVTGDGK